MNVDREVRPRTDYGRLRARLKDEGVFERQLSYYSFKAALLLALLSIALAAPFIVHSAGPRLLDAVLLAFVFTHVAFLIHDAGHRQIFRKPWHNDLAMLAMGLLVGSSRSWWFDSHNRHHANPNDPNLDPNMAIAVITFSEQQAIERAGFPGSLTRFQVYYYFPLLLAEGIGVRIASLRVLLGGNSQYRAIEAISMAGHVVIYGLFVFTAMPVMQGLFFIAIHQTLTGLYMGSVFAPNHKGMAILDPTSRVSFIQRQVLSSRNIRPHALVDFLYGGLNYQIEHHLFPKIPRNKLKTARVIVRGYCAEHSIPYHETTVWGSYVEVARYLQRVVTPLRTADRSTSAPWRPRETL